MISIFLIGGIDEFEYPPMISGFFITGNKVIQILLMISIFPIGGNKGIEYPPKNFIFSITGK